MLLERMHDLEQEEKELRWVLAGAGGARAVSP